MKTINSGVYLVLNPAIEENVLLKKLNKALYGGISIVQIWNNWQNGTGLPEKLEIIRSVVNMVRGFNLPVLINEEWELLHQSELDGVHFDSVPQNFEQIKQKLKRNFLAGITCQNDLELIRWADEHGLDYVSFCSMFPSSSVQSCEIVQPETVRKAREITQMPIFLSGGITQENLNDLKDLNFDGVAVISGILNADSPELAVRNYNKALHKIRRKA
jgi:thiamine-phosphate pyrophosphorylase